MLTSDLNRLQNIKGIGKKRLETILKKLNELQQPINWIFSMPSEQIKKVFGLPIHIAKAIAETTLEIPDGHEATKQPTLKNVTLHSYRIHVLNPTSLEYPYRLITILGGKTPQQLHIWGNLDLLNKPAVGFCGSRNVTAKGLEVTSDIAEQVAQLGWVVVSGHARGVDITAHRVALENAAGTIIVLAEGIEDFKLRQELKKQAKKENILIISEFAPKARWNVGYAMQRNTTIVALSDAMMLIESRMEGGTFNAGQTALRLNCPLFVVQYQSSSESNQGNQFFIEHGAIRLFKNQTTGQANINPLKEVVAKRQAHLHQKKATIAAPKQRSFLENDS
jgi:DNA processing protein